MGNGEKINEQLIVKEVGYLRVPKPVKDKFGSPKYYPNPDWTTQETDDQFILTYKFDKKQLRRKDNE